MATDRQTKETARTPGSLGALVFVVASCLAGPHGFGEQVATVAYASSAHTTDAGSGTRQSGSDEACVPLYGYPGQVTGLDDSQCQPYIACGDDRWQPPEFSDHEIELLMSLDLVNAPTPLSTDPYDDRVANPATAPAAGVCAVLPVDATSYRLETFANMDDAALAGAEVTHAGACGACSALADLAVYASTPDLTTPVRECAMRATFGGEEAVLECITSLGFTPPCARIWQYNVMNTRRECARTCMRSLDAPYNDADGSLNACLQCDEDASGAVFARVAGRTRRNSGLPSAICRPTDEVVRLEHDYRAGYAVDVMVSR